MSIPTPPTQPATPPDRTAIDARAREVRQRALQCAIQHAAGVPNCTVSDFWHYVAVFEHYISTGESGA